MSSNYKFFIGGAAGFAACATLLYAAGCNGESAAGGAAQGGVVAVVNGTPINEQEFNRYMMMKPVIRVNTQQGPQVLPVVSSIGFQTLDDLVRRKILMQIAKDEGVYPTDKQIEDELAFQLKRNPNFVNTLTSRGLTLAMIKEELAVELSRDNLLTKGITIQPEEVEDYIKENPREFEQPATAEVYWIYAKSDEIRNAADDQLKRGQSFPIVAKQYSEASSTAREKGRLPYEVVDTMPPMIKKIVTETPELRSTDWMEVNDGMAKFYVASKAPAKAIEITDVIRENVRRKLARRRGQAAMDLDERLMKKLAESKVEVNYATLEDPWKKHFETVQDATGNVARTPEAEEPVGGETAEGTE